MGREAVLYSVIAICITALIIMTMETHQRAEEFKLELVVECVYAYELSDDAVETCTKDIVPRILQLSASNWEVKNADELRGGSGDHGDSDGDL